MKKLITSILSLFLCLSFSGCAKNDPQASLEFFNALNETWNEDTLHLCGSMDVHASVVGTCDMELYLDQTKDVELLFEMGLDAYGASIPDFLDFYIRDGKTYLDSAGTKSQSLAKNIGLEPGKKITVWDPFLSLTDKEKEDLFTVAEKDGNNYHFELDKHKLGVYLDEMGGADITTANVDAVIEDGKLKSLDLDFSGTQDIDGNTQDLSLKAHIDVVQAGGKLEIPFPADLDSFGK